MLLLTTDAVGGVWRYTVDLARILSQSGADVAIAVLGPAPSAAQHAEARGLTIVPTSLPLDWTAPSPEALRESAAVLAGLAGRLRAKRVHLHTPALAPHAPWPVPVVAVAHSDVGTWWHTVRGGELPDDLAWRARAVAHGLAEADAVIAPSRAFARALALYYRPGRKITVVPNGRAPMPAITVPRERAVLAAGRLWDEGKNAAAVDRSAEFLDAPVRAAGAVAGPNGAAVELAHVELLGTLDETRLAAEMARASVFVSAARYEPFGLAVLEAAQCGCALALSDIPSHRELWNDAALFFHPEDDAGQRDVLSRMLDAPGIWSRRAHERAGAYTLTRMAEATLAVHAELPTRCHAA